MLNTYLETHIPYLQLVANRLAAEPASRAVGGPDDWFGEAVLEVYAIAKTYDGSIPFAAYVALNLWRNLHTKMIRCAHRQIRTVSLERIMERAMVGTQ